MSKELTNEIVVEIRLRMAAGESSASDVRALADAYGVSTDTIYGIWAGRRWLMAAGPLHDPVSLKGKPLETRRRIFAALYEQGMSSREIGARHACDHKTVLRDLHALEAQVREAGGAFRRSHARDMPEQEFAALYQTTPLEQLARELGCSLRTIEEIASARGLYKFTWADGRHEL